MSRLNGGKKLVLITGHRRENFGDGFIHMCTAIKDLTKKNTRRWTCLSDALLNSNAQTDT